MSNLLSKISSFLTARTVVAPGAKKLQPARPMPAERAGVNVAMRSDPRDRSVTALVYAIYFTMVGLVGLSLYIAFGVLFPPPDKAPAPACREDLANQCDEGEYCRDGVCIPVPNETCKDGDACGGDACLCLAPSSCGADNVCRAPSLPEKPPVCTEQMKKFVQEIVDHQANCVATAKGSMSSCPTSNVMSFLLEHDTVDALLKDFPNSLVLMFPNGQPAVTTQEGERAGAQWPDLDGGKTRSLYEDKITANETVLRGARYIVIVGRASRGSAQANFSYAQSRVSFARKMLLDTLTKTNEQTAEMSKKFLEFALGSERLLRLEFYSTNYRKPTAWWSESAPLELSGALRKLENNQPVSEKDRAIAEAVINRSVAIVAIPPECVGGR